MLDSTIHQINYYPVDKCWETNIAYIQAIAIYPVNNIIHVLNNWDPKEGFECHQHSH